MPTYTSTGVPGKRSLPLVTQRYLKHGIKEGSRDNDTFAAACQFRDCGYSIHEATAQILPRGLADGRSEYAVINNIRSAYTMSPRDCAVGVEPHSVVPPPQLDGFKKLLLNCFAADEYISISPGNANPEDPDHTIPHGGITFTRDKWLAEAQRKGGIDKVFTGPRGLFIRLNPVQRGGTRNEDVTAFRHVLVEFDRDELDQPIPKEDQWRTIDESRLPVAALIDSGGKSLHAWVKVNAKNAEQYKERVDIVWRHFEGRHIDTQNRNAARYSRCPDAHRNGSHQRLLRLNFGAKSWDEWVMRHTAHALPPPISITDFMATSRVRPPELVEGILHQGSKLVLGGCSKSRKTWALFDLACAVAHGEPWWGRQTFKGDVLYLNFELQEFAVEERFKMIERGRGMARRSLSGIHLWNLRGYATDFSVLIPQIMGMVAEGAYRLILVDPLYKGLGDRDENAAGDMGSLLNELEKLAVHTGAAVGWGAHFAKGKAADKASIDRISGSGVMARDPDTIITMTPHEIPDSYTVDATLRTLPPIESFVVSWNQENHIFTPNPGLNPDHMDGAKPKAKYTLNKASDPLFSKKAYDRLFCGMAPLPRNARVPEECDIISHIVAVYEHHAEDIDVDRAVSIFSQLRRDDVLVYDKKEGVYRGRNCQA